MKKRYIVLSCILFSLMSPFWIYRFITYPSLPNQSEMAGYQLNFSDLNSKIQEDVKGTLAGFHGGFLSNSYSENFDYTLRGSQVTMGFRCNSIQMFFSSEDPFSPVEVLISFPGSSPVVPFASEPTGVCSNYFFGSNPENWVINSPYYSRLIYRELYPNIDLVYYLINGKLKYEFIVHPGGQIDDIRIQWHGPVSLAIKPGGLEITITHKDGQISLLDTSPVYYIKDSLQAISGKFCLYDLQTYGFTTPNYDTTQILIIDPELAMSTFLGSTTFDYGNALTLDSQGNIIVTGNPSGGFPTTPSAFNTTFSGSHDIFVAKLTPNGSNLLFSTLIGGSGDDYAYSIATDASGDVYITGITDNATITYPTTLNAFNRTHSGMKDVFITKLAANGSKLIYSTLLGGNADDYGYSLAVDPTGNVIVTGNTFDWDVDLPTTPDAYDPSPNGLDDVFVTKLAANGSTLLFSTLIGGENYDRGRAVAFDPMGDIVVLGYTGAEGFPVTPGSYNTTFGGGYDVFIAKLAENGSILLFSTYLGATSMDYGYSLAVDNQGDIYVTGYTSDDPSPFPTTIDAYDRTRNGVADTFVAKLSNDGGTLIYSTLLGGSGSDVSNSISVDDYGNAFITGRTYDAVKDFPTTPYIAYDRTHNGESDVFVTELAANGSKLLYSSLFGGSGDDEALSIVVDYSGNAFITGSTMDDIIDFPTTSDTYSSTHNGYEDVFITKLSLLPQVPSIPYRLSGALSYDQKIILLWSDLFEGYPAIDRFLIYRGTVSGSYSLLDSTLGEFYVDSLIISGQTYYYAVSAINSVGESRVSNEVVVIVPEIPSTNPTTSSASSTSITSETITSSQPSTSKTLKTSSITSEKTAEASNYFGLSLVILTIISITMIRIQKR